VRRNLHRRLSALEATLGDEEAPRKAFLPEWLMESLKRDGVRFTEAGLIDRESLRRVRRPHDDAVSYAAGKA
jgi:hypothetical protein